MTGGPGKLLLEPRMTWVKPNFSETQDDRECHRVNCKILGEIFNFDE